jgi:Uma2 family endonuclease
MIQQLENLTPDRCITLYDVSWESLETLAPVLEAHGVCLTYLDGTLDLMTPSPEHEEYKSTIGLLLETYLRYSGIRFYVRGSLTLGSRELGARGEPDESYNLETKKDVPDLAIEIVLTSGGVDKLEKYRRWGVKEVWFWDKKQLSIYYLNLEYEQVAKSELLPQLNLELFVCCLVMPDQYDAVTAFEKALQQKSDR